MTSRRVLAVLIASGAACGGSPNGNGGDPDARGAAAGEAGPGDAAATPALCSGLAQPPADDSWKVQGRDVVVHVPASYDATKPTAIVIALHGLASSGADQAHLSHLAAKSESAGFIAIAPDGTGSTKSWNAGDCCDPAKSSGVDDTAFISALIDEAETRLCVDKHRVFATGFSNGGYLAHQLACELSDRIAAIGAVSGVLGHEACTPTRPVPVLHIHGTSDLVVPFAGGGFNGSMSVDDTIAGWRTRNQCADQPATTFVDHGDATCVSHGGCAAGADVALCTIDGGGHQWPGGISVGPLNGKDSSDLSATDQIWAFFAAHPMP